MTGKLGIQVVLLVPVASSEWLLQAKFVLIDGEDGVQSAEVTGEKWYLTKNRYTHHSQLFAVAINSCDCGSQVDFEHSRCVLRAFVASPCYGWLESGDR